MRFRVSVYRGKTIARGSIRAAMRRVRPLQHGLWIPPDATAVVAVVWVELSSGAVRALSIEAGNPGVETVRDRSRVAALLATLRVQYYRSDEADWPAIERRVAAMAPPPSHVDPLPIVALFVRDQWPGNRHMFVVLTLPFTTTSPTAAVPPTCGDLGPPLGLGTIPGITAIDGDGPARYASALHDCLMASPTARPWVIDLRGNGGGNMDPMIAGSC